MAKLDFSFLNIFSPIKKACYLGFDEFGGPYYTCMEYKNVAVKTAKAGAALRCAKRKKEAGVPEEVAGRVRDYTYWLTERDPQRLLEPVPWWKVPVGKGKATRVGRRKQKPEPKLLPKAVEK